MEGTPPPPSRPEYVSSIEPIPISSMEPVQMSSVRPLGTQPFAIPRGPRLPNTPARSREINTAEENSISIPADDKFLCPGQLAIPLGTTCREPKRAWILELASLLIAMMAFSGIIDLLATQKDREQPNLPTLPINTLLSSLATVLTATLLFPVSQASSGMERKGAFLGAVLALLSITVTLVSQQALRFYSCSQIANSTDAKIYRTNGYYDGPSPSSINQSSDAMTTFNLNLTHAMTAAIYRGVLGPPENFTSMMSVFCASGDCKFGKAIGAVDTYSSLAICSSVDGTSTQIRDETWDTNGWNFSLPSGHQLTRDSVMVTRQLVQNASSLEEDRPLFAFEILMVTRDCGKNTESVYGDTHGCRIGDARTAFNVSLFPCVQKYGNIRYKNGALHQNILPTTRLPLIDFDQAAHYSLATEEHPPPASILNSLSNADCSPATRSDGDKYVKTFALESGREYRPLFNGTVEELVANGGMASFYDPLCIYELGSEASNVIARALGALFGGPAEMKKHNPLDLPDRNESNDGGIVGDPWLKLLWKNGMADLDSVRLFINGLAWSISAAMPRSGDDWDERPFRGAVYENRTCMGVDWLWVSYPEGVLILVVVFFIFTTV